MASDGHSTQPNCPLEAQQSGVLQQLCLPCRSPHVSLEGGRARLTSPMTLGQEERNPGITGSPPRIQERNTRQEEEEARSQLAPALKLSEVPQVCFQPAAPLGCPPLGCQTPRRMCSHKDFTGMQEETVTPTKVPEAMDLKTLRPQTKLQFPCLSVVLTRGRPHPLRASFCGLQRLQVGLRNGQASSCRGPIGSPDPIASRADMLVKDFVPARRQVRAFGWHLRVRM